MTRGRKGARHDKATLHFAAILGPDRVNQILKEGCDKFFGPGFVHRDQVFIQLGRYAGLHTNNARFPADLTSKVQALFVLLVSTGKIGDCPGRQALWYRDRASEAWRIAEEKRVSFTAKAE